MTALIGTNQAPSLIGPGTNWAKFLGLTIAVNSEVEGDCIIWRGSLSAGYPQLTTCLGSFAVHRYACAAWHGPAAVVGKDVHHTCERKACVNPAHLVPLTPSEHRAVHTKAMPCPTPKRSDSTEIITWPEMYAAVSQRKVLR